MDATLAKTIGDQNYRVWRGQTAKIELQSTYTLVLLSKLMQIVFEAKFSLQELIHEP